MVRPPSLDRLVAQERDAGVVRRRVEQPHLDLLSLERARSLADRKLSEAIPRDCFVQRPWRGLLGFLLSYGLWGGAIYGLSIAPHALLYLPLWIVAGLGGWGLHCIAHDCGHLDLLDRPEVYRRIRRWLDAG